MEVMVAIHMGLLSDKTLLNFDVLVEQMEAEPIEHLLRSYGTLGIGHSECLGVDRKASLLQAEAWRTLRVGLVL